MCQSQWVRESVSVRERGCACSGFHCRPGPFAKVTIESRLAIWLITLLDRPSVFRKADSYKIFWLAVDFQLCLGGFAEYFEVDIWAVQGYLSHKKQCPLRALQWDYAYGPIVFLGGGQFLISEVPLQASADRLSLS